MAIQITKTGNVVEVDYGGSRKDSISGGTNITVIGHTDNAGVSTISVSINSKDRIRLPFLEIQTINGLARPQTLADTLVLLSTAVFNFGGGNGQGVTTVLGAYPADSPVAGISVYKAAASGTFVNFGGLVVSSAEFASGDVSLVQAISGSWSKVIVPLSLAGYARTTDLEGLNANVKKPKNTSLLGLQNQTSGLRTITATGLGGGSDVLQLVTTAARQYTTRIAVSFTKTTGLTELRGYVGTTVSVFRPVATIVLGQELSLYWTGSAGIGNVILSQFRLQCNGPVVDVEYTIRYIVVYEDVVPESTIVDAEVSKFNIALFSNRAATALLADRATLSDKATTSGVAERAPSSPSMISATHEKQFDPTTWTIANDTLGTKFDAAGQVILVANPTQVKVQIPNAVTIGTQYIVIFNVYDLIFYNGATQLRVFNFSQLLLDGITKAGLYYAVFTATVIGELQILLSVALAGLDAGSPVATFKTNMCVITPYSQELEEKLAIAKVNYNGGRISPLQTLSTLTSPGIINFPQDSFKVLQAKVNKVTQKTLDVNILDYQAFGGASNPVVVYQNNLIQITALCLPSGPSPYFFKYGVRVTPPVYADKTRTFVLVCEGVFTGTNTTSVLLGAGGTYVSPTILLSAPADGVPSSFKGLIEVSYPVNYNGNGQYLYIDQIPVSTAVDQQIDYSISAFFLFEKVEGWLLDDYLVNHKKALIVPNFLPDSGVNKSYVDQRINAINQTVATINEKSPFTQNFQHDINMLICYGQSLAVGGGAADLNTDVRNVLSFPGGCNEWFYNVDITNPASVASFYGEQFVPLTTLKAVTSLPPVVTAALAWMYLLETENAVDLSSFDYQFLLSSPGYSGAPIESFVKGTVYYDRLLFSVQKGYDFALAALKTYAVPCLFWVQGEANRNDSQSAYYTKLEALFTDLNADIKAITGQADDVQFITYQTSPTVGIDGYTDAGPSFAQLALAKDKANVHFGGAMYQFIYDDVFHPTDRAVIGLQMGIQAKRVVSDRAPLPLFAVKSHFIQNQGLTWLLSINFVVPVSPMRFDVSGDIWHNPNGKQVNYGFQLINAQGESIILGEPVIKRGNTLVIACTQDPAGAKLSYALDGHYGGGNLCDSQNIIINNKNINYVVDNFCPSFRDYVI